MTRWRVHGEAPLYTSEWINLCIADVELPDGTRHGHHLGRMNFPAAGVVIRDGERGVLLLRRHRFITDTWGWEIPAGRVDPGETPEHAVERESIEETGFRPLGLSHMGFSHPSNGLVDQRFEYFTADGAEYVCEFDRTETESVAWFAPKDVRTLIAQGEV